MPYTQEQGRAFWLAFDNHFKFEAQQNGLWARYESWGGYNHCYSEWLNARSSGNFPGGLVQFSEANRENLEFVADEQEAYFTQHFDGRIDDITAAFKDFAFGILESHDQPNRGAEPVHTMNGSEFAGDYASWHGYIETMLLLRPDSEFWINLRWINGMAWELQVKARPQEIYPNHNTPLDSAITTAIEAKWRARTAEEMAKEFEDYQSKPFEWLS